MVFGKKKQERVEFQEPIDEEKFEEEEVEEAEPEVPRPQKPKQESKPVERKLTIQDVLMEHERRIRNLESYAFRSA